LLEKGENQKFFKNFACKPWFWALLGKKLLEFKHFLTPPRNFCKFSSFIAVLSINFGPFWSEIANFFFFLARIWAILQAKKSKNLEFSSYSTPPIKFCKIFKFYSIFEHQFWAILG
jgi:hypothetical protein